MQLFRHREDRIPVLLVALLFAVDVGVYFLVASPWLLALWCALGIIPKGLVCAFNHHHQHVPVFRPTILNRLLELVYGLQTGATTNTWVLHHSLGHHVTYLDQTKDESRWLRRDGTQMGVIEYSFAVALTAYPRAWAVGKRYPRHRRNFLGMGLVTLAIIGAAIAYKPAAGVLVFVLPPIISLVGTAWATYVHHAGKSTKDVFANCNNVTMPLYNLVTGNLGYHAAHHYKAGVHWSKLPALHKEIEHLLDADSYTSPGFPWGWLDRSGSSGSPSGSPSGQGARSAAEGRAGAHQGEAEPVGARPGIASAGIASS